MKEQNKETIKKIVVPEVINLAFSMMPGFGTIASSIFNGYLKFKDQKEFEEQFSELSEEMKKHVIEKTKEMCLGHIQEDHLDISINRIEFVLKTDEDVEDCVNVMNNIMVEHGFAEEEIDLGPVDEITFNKNKVIVGYLYGVDKQEALEYAAEIIKVINEVCDLNWESAVKDVIFG